MFGQQESRRGVADEIPFPQVPARHSVEGDRGRERDGREDEEGKPEVHAHRISSNGPISSHSHIVTCTDQHPKDERSKGERAKETASGVKGLVAAVHGVGEKVRGGFNAGVDRAFNDVCEPPAELFPHLGVLDEWRCDEDGEGKVWRESQNPTAPPSVDNGNRDEAFLSVKREDVC